MDDDPMTIRALFEDAAQEFQTTCGICGQRYDRRELSDMLYHRRPAPPDAEAAGRPLAKCETPGVGAAL
jgi:hypothetical protein